jgi:hypothetical protein
VRQFDFVHCRPKSMELDTSAFSHSATPTTSNSDLPQLPVAECE